jgi:hypothetical protein
MRFVFRRRGHVGLDVSWRNPSRKFCSGVLRPLHRCAAVEIVYLFTVSSRPLRVVSERGSPLLLDRGGGRVRSRTLSTGLVFAFRASDKIIPHLGPLPLPKGEAKADRQTALNTDEIAFQALNMRRSRSGRSFSSFPVFLINLLGNVWDGQFLRRA